MTKKKEKDKQVFLLYFYKIIVFAIGFILGVTVFEANMFGGIWIGITAIALTFGISRGKK